MVERDVLEKIGDSIVMFFPLFHRKLMKGQYPGIKKPPAQQYPLLGRLMWQGPLPMSELARGICMSKPNMTSLINQMVVEGKVKRSADKYDKRVVKISITKKGVDFMKAHQKLVKDNIRANLSSLGESDIKKLYMSMENIKAIISKIDEDKE